MADTTTTTYSLVKPEVGASADTWGTKLNTNLDSIDNLLDGTTAISPNLTALKINGADVTSSAAELNVLDGVTATTAELNYVDGVTSNIQAQIDSKAPTASPTFSGSVVVNGWTISEASGDLFLSYGGANKMKLDTSGNLTVVGDVTAFGTI